MADNSASLVPGRNPTGGPLYGDMGFVPGAGTSSGANPMLPAPNLPASAPMSNPYGTSIVPPAGGVPNFGANSGGYSSTSLMPPGAVSSGTPGATNVSTAQSSPIGGLNLTNNKDMSRLFSDLKKTYGDGTAHALLNFLTTGAGFNQDAINNLLAAMQPQIERGTESLMNQFSTTGNRFSSGAQIGLADFLSQVNLNMGQIESQMYENAVSNYMNTLMGVGAQNAQTKANSPSFMDKLGGILGLTSTGAGALGEMGVGADGALGTILGGLSFI
jgi:hypothetical protein